MKVTVLVLLSILTANTWAQEIPGCQIGDLQKLEASILTQISENSPRLFHIFYMKNTQGQTIGYFGTDNDRNVHTEVCEFQTPEGVTASHIWKKWNSDAYAQTNPALWARDGRYKISSSKGSASMRMVQEETSRGEVTVELKVMGLNRSSQEVLLMNDIIKFEMR